MVELPLNSGANVYAHDLSRGQVTSMASSPPVQQATYLMDNEAADISADEVRSQLDEPLFEAESLWRTTDLYGYTVWAQDGAVGRVHDFCFDDQSWAIRYLVVDLGDWALDTGEWLPGQKVLVPDTTLGQPNREADILPIRLTKAQVAHSPQVNSSPASFSTAELSSRLPGGLLNSDLGGVHPDILSETMRVQYSEQILFQSQAETLSLLTLKDILGYRIQALDGERGHLEDVVIDDRYWLIHFILIDTRNWLPGKKVAVASSWVDHIETTEAKVYVNLSQDLIKNSPPFDSKDLPTPELWAKMAQEAPLA